MKRILRLVALVGISALAVNQASAALNFVVNGDFEAGNTAFTSGYTYTTGSMYPEGTYTVDTNPFLHHNLWDSMGDHTSGVGNMLIVNAAVTPGVNVWAGTLTSALTVGMTYKLSAWVANIYPDSPANLNFSVGGTQVGSTFTPTGNATWTLFTTTFVAGANQATGLIDLNTAAGGNDFAIDDISVVAVPEPTTIVAGAMLLLPFGASTLRVIRRRSEA